MIFNKREGSEPTVPSIEASASDPGTGRIDFSFSASSNLGVFLRDAKLGRAAASAACSPADANGCTWTDVDSASAPPQTASWNDSSSLSDVPPAGAFVYTVKVSDVEDGVARGPVLMIAAANGTPHGFDFTNQTNVPASTAVTSNIVQMTGLVGSVGTSIAGGSGAYRVCADATCSTNPAFITTASTTANNAYLQLRLTSSAVIDAMVSTTMAVGTVSDVWSVTTGVQDITPNPVSFTNQTGIAPGTQATSNVIQITGISGAVATSFAGTNASYQVCTNSSCTMGSGWITTPATLQNGNYVQMRILSSASWGATESRTLTIGATAFTWSVTTPVDPCAGTPTPGTTCADGSKFAGMSPWTGTKLYMTAADYTGKVQFAWPQTVHGVHSNTDGLANTNSLSQYGNYHAVDACYYLTAHGKSDWYLPAPYEWNTIDPYRQAIGGFQPDGTAFGPLQSRTAPTPAVFITILAAAAHSMDTPARGSRTTCDACEGIEIGEQDRLRSDVAMCGRLKTYPERDMKVQSQRGYAMVALLVGLSVMAVLLTVVMPAWKQAAQREKEAELIFRGQQYARAIGLFQRKAGPGVLPPNLDVLVEQHLLRRKYTDPMTGRDFDVLAPVQSAAAGQVSTGAPAETSAPTGSSASSGLMNTGANIGDTAGAPLGRTVGGVMGVASRSKAASLRIYNGRTHYNEWQFLYTAQTMRPGGGGVPLPGGSEPTLGGTATAPAR
jgi:type II secretory pathway pseudopilin PulG